MKNAGMPLTTQARITYVEVAEPTKLAYTHLADFIPGVEPYDVATVVEFHSEGDETKMVLTFDAMHDEQWTNLARMGHEGQLEKLAAALAA